MMARRLSRQFHHRRVYFLYTITPSNSIDTLYNNDNTRTQDRFRSMRTHIHGTALVYHTAVVILYNVFRIPTAV